MPNVRRAATGTLALENYYRVNKQWGVIGGDSTVLMGISTSQPFSSTYYTIGGTGDMAASNSGIRDIGHISNLEFQALNNHWYFFAGAPRAGPNFGPGPHINPSPPSPPPTTT